MKYPLATAPAAGRRVQSRNERGNFPPRQAPDDKPLTRSDLFRALEEANSRPATRPEPERITAADVAGMTPQQALDAVNGDNLDPLRHRAGSVSRER